MSIAVLPGNLPLPDQNVFSGKRKFNEKENHPQTTPKKPRKANSSETPIKSASARRAPFTPARPQRSCQQRGVFKEAAPGISLQFNGRRYQLEELGSGTYKTVYRLKGSNSIVKFYRDDQVRRNPNQKLENWTRHAIKQSFILQKGALPTARLYNNPLQDGYFVYQMIQNPCIHDAKHWRNPNTNVADLPKDVRNRLAQIRTFVQFALKNNVDLDVALDNFRYDEQGTVYLCDMTEESQHAQSFITTTLKQRFCQGNGHILKYLLGDYA